MSARRLSVLSLSVALCVALLTVMLPAAALAQDGTLREYIVTLDVKEADVQSIVEALVRVAGLQVVFDPDTEETFATAESVRNEFVLQVEGRVRRRPEGTVNPDMPTGQVEVLEVEGEGFFAGGEFTSGLCFLGQA